MARVVSLYLPTWSTDRLRRKSGAAAPPVETPLVLIGCEGRSRVVLAVDAAAQAAGLRVGMSETKARALVSGLVIEDADPLADTEAIERLAGWVLQHYAPIAAADPPDGLVIDTTGVDHLHGGEEAMLADMIDRFSGVGITARAAIADTWGAAHALARYGSRLTMVSPRGAGKAAIAALPLAALRIPTDMVASLRVLGFTQIADLLAQPRAPLTLRFGPELGRRIDQALGEVCELIDPIRPPNLIEVRRSFPEPISAAETIARYIGKLVDALCIKLEAKGLGARRLDLSCHRVDNRAQAIRVGTALPVRDARRLTQLLCDKIETIDPGFGIEIMMLCASIAELLPDRQRVTSLVEKSVPDVSKLVDTLANRVGGLCLYRASPVASDVPERAVTRIPAMAPETGVSWLRHWPRPARLLARPEPIEILVLTRDHAPVAFTWRGICHHVVCADGPERIFGEWWKCDAEMVAVRDYFQVENDAGERYWIYFAGDGENAVRGHRRWFLHGVFG